MRALSTLLSLFVVFFPHPCACRGGVGVLPRSTGGPGSSCQLATPVSFPSSPSLSLSLPDSASGLSPAFLSLPSSLSRCSSSYFTGTGAAHWFRLDDVRADQQLDLLACGFDTDLSVLKGSCSNLSLVACNGDGEGGTCGVQYYSHLEGLRLLANQTYFILLGGYDGETGAANLTVTYTDVPPVEVEGDCVFTHGGACAASAGYPNEPYRNRAECTIRNVPSLPLEVLDFSVEFADNCLYDALTINSQAFCGSEGPVGVVPADGLIRWETDGSVNDRGWEICWLPRPSPPPNVPPSPPSPPSSPPSSPSPPYPPPPPPLPPQPPLPPHAPAVEVEGPCLVTNGGSCIASPGYPMSNYPNSQTCVVFNVPAVPLHVLFFEVESEYSSYSGYEVAEACVYDFLTVGGTRYCGDAGPAGVIATDGVIRWKADSSVTEAGWEICFAQQPPSPPPQPPAPPLPPLTPPRPPPPPPPPFAPLPPMRPGDTVIESLHHLRTAFDAAVAAAAQVSLLLAPGVAFTLSNGALKCTTPADITLRGSPGGFGLDGGGMRRLFEVSGGCSLTLEGLSLSAGYAADAGGLLRVTDGARVMLDRCTISDSASEDDGGAFFVEGAELLIHNTTVTNCHADNGGALLLDSGTVTMEDVAFSTMSANADGGTIQMNGGILRVSRAVFTDCHADSDGGVLHLKGGEAELRGAVVTRATAWWGALLSVKRDGVARLSDSAVADCHAGLGGFIAVFEGAVHVNSTTVARCMADLDGGAVFMDSGTAHIVTLARTNVLDCRAGRNGGAVFAAGGTLSMSEGTLFRGNTATSGLTFYVSAGELSYVLPAAPGHWMPNARCKIFRKGCPYSQYSVKQVECLAHRLDCEVNLEGDPDWHCQPPTFVQPCNWDDSRGGDSSLLGRQLYQLPLLPLDVDFPFPCSPGVLGSAEATWQTSSTCAGPCPAGFYCPEEATIEPIVCPPGRYCPEASSRPLSCPAGTFSNTTSLTAESECTSCPLGHECPTGSIQPSPCLPGTFGPIERLAACLPCPPGSAAFTGSSICTRCAAGEYAANKGQGECVKCPHPLSSNEGSETCSRCLAGYYLRDARSSPAAIFAKPTDFCLPCPVYASCPMNSTIQTLVVPPNYWRDSLLSSELYECDPGSGGATNTTCLGTAKPGYLLDEQAVDRYCAEGHFGPRCQACSMPNHFFNDSELRCQACPGAWRLAVLAAMVLAVAALLVAAYVATQRFNTLARLTRRVSGVITSLSLQAKFKIVVSFYQVAVSLGSVYGVQLHRDFTRWLDAIGFVNVDLLEFFMPGSCIGSMESRLLLSALWPCALIIILVMLIALHSTGVHIMKRGTGGSEGILVPTIYRSLYALILVCFLVLPSVSRSIFKARQCESFGYNDETDERRSYLLAELTVQCSQSDDTFVSLNAFFIAFFVLWPVLVPLFFLFIVLRVAPYVRRQRISRLAKACRFLWRDYDRGMLYWETIDMLRKLFLTSIILFVDVEYGSSRLLRLVLASIISAVYLAAIALARPYANPDDLYLACLSNMLLTCCFISGVAIKLCEEGRWSDSCAAFTGISDSYQTTIFVVVISVAMVCLSVLIMLSKVAAAISAPTIRLVSSGREPTLDLPSTCRFHAFVSHAWGTGQDQTHTIVRQLKLLLPDIRIWLDVDDLDDLGQLEEYVKQCAVIVIFLSQGYFRSANCRRELYTALRLGKPLVVVRETNRDKGGLSTAEHEEEVRLVCIDEAPPSHPKYRGPEEVLSSLFLEEPVVWVRTSGFQLESLKLIALRMLRHLPNYTRNPQPLLRGLKVKGEVRPSNLSSRVTLLVSEANEGAHEVARALEAAATNLAGSAQLTLACAEAELHEEGGRPAGRAAMLLYLTSRTFLDGCDTLMSSVRRALDSKVTVVMLHEQDMHGGNIRDIILQTPLDLRLPPYQLYDSLAIPYFPSPEHRTISIWKALRAVDAAVVPSAQFLTQLLQRASQGTARLSHRVEGERSLTVSGPTSTSNMEKAAAGADGISDGLQEPGMDTTTQAV